MSTKKKLRKLDRIAERIMDRDRDLSLVPRVNGDGVLSYEMGFSTCWEVTPAATTTRAVRKAIAAALREYADEVEGGEA